MRPVVLTLVTLAASCLLSPAGQAAEQRLWKDATGKFQIQAVLVEQTATSVRLQTTDGREISVPVQRLSQADQDYLKSRCSCT